MGMRGPWCPTADMMVAGLTVPERVLLFCLATDTDWRKAGVTHSTEARPLNRASGASHGRRQQNLSR
jgi:hypothetical protein